MKKLDLKGFNIFVAILLFLSFSTTANAYVAVEILPENPKLKVLRLYPEETGSYIIRVINTENTLIESLSLKVTVSESLAIVKGLKTASYEVLQLKDILPGEAREIKVKVKPVEELKEGVEKRVITVYYGSEAYTGFSGTYVEVMESPLEIKADLKKPTINKGETNEVSVELKNVSQERIENIRVMLRTPENFQVKEHDYNLAYLNPGDSFKKTFSFSPEPSIVGRQYIALIVEFEDSYGTHFIEKNFAVDVQDKALGATILLAIIVALVVVYLMIKGQKKAQQ